MKILITGFDPFGGETVNPAWEAVSRLPDEISGARVVRLMLPTVFGRAGELLCDAVRRERPDAVICVGQAGGRAAITPERVAINLMDGTIPDNAGFKPSDEPVVPGGPDAYFTNLPVRRIVARLHECGIPAELSYTAGSYVCNYLMYTLMHLIRTEYPAMLGGFIHIPFSTEQAVSHRGAPSMDIATAARGLECAVAAVVE